MYALVNLSQCVRTCGAGDDSLENGATFIYLNVPYTPIAIYIMSTYKINKQTNVELSNISVCVRSVTLDVFP